MIKVTIDLPENITRVLEFDGRDMIASEEIVDYVEEIESWEIVDYAEEIESCFQHIFMMLRMRKDVRFAMIK